MRLGLAIAATVWGAGCILYVDAAADLTVTWTFRGWDCDAAGIDEVALELVAEDGRVAGADRVACRWGGATYRDLAPGRYALHLDGLARGAVLYHADGVVEAHGGDNAYHVDLDFVR